MSFSVEAIYDDSTTAKKKAMKRLTCRKCEGHGLSSILKGHASVCPYNTCECTTCASVMSMRANALIRRFRHRQPAQNTAVLKKIRSKNGNLRLRILPSKGGEPENGTTVTYNDEKSYNSSRRSSYTTVVSSDRSSSAASILTSTNNSSPSISPPLLSPYGFDTSGKTADCLQQLLTNTLLQQLLNNYQQSLLLNQTPLLPGASIPSVPSLLPQLNLNLLSTTLQMPSVV